MGGAKVTPSVPAVHQAQRLHESTMRREGRREGREGKGRAARYNTTSEYMNSGKEETRTVSVWIREGERGSDYVEKNGT